MGVRARPASRPARTGIGDCRSAVGTWSVKAGRTRSRSADDGGSHRLLQLKRTGLFLQFMPCLDLSTGQAAKYIGKGR